MEVLVAWVEVASASSKPLTLLETPARESSSSIAVEALALVVESSSLESASALLASSTSAFAEVLVASLAPFDHWAIFPQMLSRMQSAILVSSRFFSFLSLFIKFLLLVLPFVLLRLLPVGELLLLLHEVSDVKFRSCFGVSSEEGEFISPFLGKCVKQH